MDKQIHAFISGRVQGVWYRASAQQKAQQLKLTGWVRNLVDGRVELVAQGDETHLHELLDWCQIGPENAEVNHIETFWEEISEAFSAFDKKATC